MSRDERIKALADEARSVFGGSTLYGEPVDLANVDHLLAMLLVTKQLGDSARDTMRSINEVRGLASRVRGFR